MLLLVAASAAAQPAAWVQGPERPILGLVRHADGWYVLLGDPSHAPPTVSIAPVSPAGVGAPMASVTLEGGQWPIALVASAEQGRAPWVITQGRDRETVVVRAVRADGSAAPVQLLRAAAPPAEAELLASAWRPGTQPLGAFVFRGRTFGPMPRLRREEMDADYVRLPERPTREAWIAHAVGARVQRTERVRRFPLSREHIDQRAVVAVGPADAVAVHSFARDHRGLLRILRLDRNARVRGRIEDALPAYGVHWLSDAALDAAGTTWIGALVRPVRPPGAVERAAVISLAPRARAVTVRELAYEPGEWSGPLQFLECGGTVWTVRTWLRRAGIEHVVAERADGTGNPIVLATRRATDYTPPSGGPHPSRAVRDIRLACDATAREAAAVLHYPRRPDDRRPEIALVTWNAGPGTEGE